MVPIQALDPVDSKKIKQNTGNGREVDTEAAWKRQYIKREGPGECNVLAYMENCTGTFANHENSFFGAFLAAYNTHQDVLLAPDDVWLLICLQFAKHVNANAESLREMLVSHEGKKELTVTTWNEQSESQWYEFFTLMQNEISKNTKGDIIDLLQSNFTTTGLVEQMVSTAAVMDSFKQYFKYNRCIPLCGIRNVCFTGSLEDWQSIIQRARSLMKYDVGESWKSFINGIEPILQNFVSTYEGHVDQNWWNTIMNIERGRRGSGSTTYVSGWILRLFGLDDRCDIGDIPSYAITVPVKIDNKQTGVIKTVHLLGGFGGIHAVDVQGRKAYRPQMSMIVLHRSDVA